MRFYFDSLRDVARSVEPQFLCSSMNLLMALFSLMINLSRLYVNLVD